MEASPPIRHKSKTATRPSPTTRNKLPVSLENRILRDLEDHRFGKLKFADLCLLRPEYGTPESSHLRSAVRNKFNYFKKLKREDVNRYWRLYSAASKGQQLQPPRADSSESDEDIDIEGSHSEQDEESSREEEGHTSVSSLPSTSSSHRNWQSPTATPRIKLVKPPPANLKSLASASSFSTIDKASMSSNTQGRKHSAFATKSPGGQAKKVDSNESQGMFESLADAEEHVDEVIYVDVDFPERNGEFFIHRVNEVRDPTGTEMIDQIKITLHHIIDVRDFKMYKAFLVLDGNAVLIQKPAVPYFLLHNIKELFQLEKLNCTRTQDAHTVHANRIKADDECMVRSILLVLPDGMRCIDANADLIKKKKQKKGQQDRIKKSLRFLELSFQSGKEAGDTVQGYYPIFWLLRILDSNRRILKADDDDEEDDDDDIDAAMQGMKGLSFIAPIQDLLGCASSWDSQHLLEAVNVGIPTGGTCLDQDEPPVALDQQTEKLLPDGNSKAGHPVEGAWLDHGEQPVELDRRAEMLLSDDNDDDTGYPDEDASLVQDEPPVELGREAEELLHDYSNTMMGDRRAYRKRRHQDRKISLEVLNHEESLMKERRME